MPAKHTVESTFPDDVHIVRDQNTTRIEKLSASEVAPLKLHYVASLKYTNSMATDHIKDYSLDEWYPVEDESTLTADELKLYYAAVEKEYNARKKITDKLDSLNAYNDGVDNLSDADYAVYSSHI